MPLQHSKHIIIYGIYFYDDEIDFSPLLEDESFALIKFCPQYMYMYVL